MMMILDCYLLVDVVWFDSCQYQVNILQKTYSRNPKDHVMSVLVLASVGSRLVKHEDFFFCNELNE